MQLCNSRILVSLLACWGLVTPVFASQQVEANQLLKRGIEQYRMGQLRGAIEAWEAAAEAFESGGNRHGEGSALANLGIAHRALGNYVQAMDYLHQALVIKQEIGDLKGEAAILGNLANAYAEVGDYEEAIAKHEASLEIVRTIGNRRREGIVLSNLGVVYANQGEYEQAIEHQQQSLAIAQEIGDREGAGHAYNNLGNVYHALHDEQQALEYYQKSLAVAQEIEHYLMQASVLSNLGAVYESLGNYEQGIKYQQQSLQIARSIGASRKEALALNNLAHVFLAAGRLKEAETTLYDAIALLDILREQLNDKYQISLFDTQAMTYNLLQQVLVAQQRPEAALEMAERGRARAFVHLVSQRLADNSLNQSPSIRQIKQIARRQNATLVEYAIMPEDLMHQGKVRGEGGTLYIWVVQPRGQIHFRQVDLSQEKDSLGDAAERSRVAAATGRQRGGAIANLVRGTRADVAQTATAQIKNIKNRRLQQGYQLLIEPIADLLPQNPEHKVIFLPQNELFLVPFTALQDREGKYLIEKHTIISAPAIQVLALSEQQRQRNREVLDNNKRALIVGNPTMPSLTQPGAKPVQLESLPGAEVEALNIAQMLDTEALTGDSATKAAILEQMPQASIIHLATHGLLGNYGGDIPGAIALAPTKQDSGFLSASEIINLNLHAELVVLSACDTGRGEITGDGVVGLSRSILAAGASSIIVSLWRVPDEPTSELMQEFYHQLQQHSDQAQALRAAMLITIKKYPQPKNWAAFTLIGVTK